MVDLPSSFQDIELLILDMDGVITSEQAYWDAAGLTVRELLESPAFLGLNPPSYSPIADVFYRKLVRGSRNQWRKYLPTPLIMHSKMRGVNNNWDIAYLTFGLYWSSLISATLPYFDSQHPDPHPYGMLMESDNGQEYSTPSWEDSLKDDLIPIWDHLQKEAQNGFGKDFFRSRDFHLWGSYLRRIGRSVTSVPNIEMRVIDDFHPDLKGLQLLDALNNLVQSPLNRRVHLFGRETHLWQDCRDLFQSWYLGEELYTKTYNRPLYYRPKPGLIYNEEPLLGIEQTKHALTNLRRSGYRLGIATGRPRMEIRTPLLQWNLLHLFEQNRIVTNDDVEECENQLIGMGKMYLSKPHPFVFVRAVYPTLSRDDQLKICETPIPDASKVLVIGDTQADIWAAQKMGCRVAAVLSGAVGLTGKKQLEEAKPDFICNNVLELSDALCRSKRMKQIILNEIEK